MASSFEGVYAAALTPLRDDLLDHRAVRRHCRRLLDDGLRRAGDLRHHRRGELVLGRRARRRVGGARRRRHPRRHAAARHRRMLADRRGDADARGARARRPRRARAAALLLQGRLRRRPVPVLRRADRARRRRPPAAVPVPHPAADGPRVLVRADRPAARRLPGRDRRHQGLRGDAARIEAVCREFPQLRVFAGTEALLLDTLRWGGAGCISATVNVTAPLSAEVFPLTRSRRSPGAADGAARCTSSASRSSPR